MRASENGVLKNSVIFFHTPSALAKSVFYYPVCAGEFICDASYHVKREAYNSFLLMYIEKGQGVVRCGGKTMQAKANDAVLLNCYKPHEYYTETGWTTKWIHFDGNNSLALFELIRSLGGNVISLQGAPGIRGRFDEMLEGFRSSAPQPEPLMSCDIHRILSELLILCGSGSVCGKKQNPCVAEAVGYIEEHYRERLSIGDVASSVRMSVFHFSRQFKKETGYSPYEFILKTRIDRAKSLLKNTDMRIKEIAYELGFSSESSFIYAFEKNTGISPGTFRSMPF